MRMRVIDVTKKIYEASFKSSSIAKISRRESFDLYPRVSKQSPFKYLHIREHECSIGLKRSRQPRIQVRGLSSTLSAILRYFARVLNRDIIRTPTVKVNYALQHISQPSIPRRQFASLYVLYSKQ